MPLGKPLLDALDRMGYGGLILDTAGKVLRVNSTGASLLSAYSAPGTSNPDLHWAREALKSLLRSEGASRFTMKEDAWVVIRREAEARQPLILHSVPITEGSAFGPHTVVILVDLNENCRPTSEALQKIFGLTSSEARLASE